MGALAASPGVAVMPAPEQVALQSNYITNFDFLNQYLPDTYSEEFERYGNRSVASFLRMVGAETPFSSDLLKWTEQGRLHAKYVNCASSAAATTDLATITVNDTLDPGTGSIAIRPGQTVHIYDTATTGNAGANKAIVTAVDTVAGTFDVSYYEAAGQSFAADDVLGVYVYGSEFKKGTAGMSGSLEANTNFFENKPIILKDNYATAASDMAQMGWVEVTTEDGGSGFLWYLKSQHETRIRFEDYMETSLVEAIPAAAGSGAAALTTGTGPYGSGGTEGFFYVVGSRGNVWGGGVPETLADWDQIVKRLDKQGAIEENVIFEDRDLDFAISDFLADLSTTTGASYGLFDNSESMALDLGFTGFRRGYDFYKNDWKYLNDPQMRGGMPDEAGAIKGAIVPAGSKTVYDEVLGKNVKRPFLHVRFRKSEAEDRKYKTWITGSAGGAQTSDVDEMRVNFLTERALCTLGANNFFLIQTS
jgi:hypothetical protein